MAFVKMVSGAKKYLTTNIKLYFFEIEDKLLTSTMFSIGFVGVSAQIILVFLFIKLGIESIKLLILTK